jgi:hypothetical protein
MKGTPSQRSLKLKDIKRFVSQGDEANVKDEVYLPGTR